MSKKLRDRWKAVANRFAVVLMELRRDLGRLEMCKKLGDRWKAVSSRFAVVLAVLALLVSVLTWSDTRAHNRLSVMPYVGFAVVLGPHESFPYAGIWAINYGAGVAIMEELIVHVDDQPAESLSHALHDIGLFPRDDLTIYCHRELGSFLGPGERRCVICIDLELFREEHEDIMEAAFDRLDLHLDYRSMYDEWAETDLWSISSLP